MQVPKATLEVLYEGKNITGDIMPYMRDFTYTDRATGEADEISIELEDNARLWQLDWYPTHGDNVSAKILYQGEALSCGVFTIDEVVFSFSSSGDIVTIKALAAGVTKELRSLSFAAHERKTLREIANTIASKHGLKVEGSIPDIRVERKTQYKKTDLHFLQELANDYGYSFNVREDRLTFTNMFELEGQAAALTLNRDEFSALNITDKTAQTFRAVEIKYHHPKKKRTIVYTKGETDPAFAGTKSDTLTLRKRVENEQQAELLSRVALYKANSLKQEGSIELPGNVYLVAGVSIQLQGVGMCSGKYYITESSHSVSPSGGYSTSANIKRVGLIDKNSY